jgi:hypothetical protein
MEAKAFQVVRRRRATDTTQLALSDVINQSIRRKLMTDARGPNDAPTAKYPELLRASGRFPD